MRNSDQFFKSLQIHCDYKLENCEIRENWKIAPITKSNLMLIYPEMCSEIICCYSYKLYKSKLLQLT